jgi:hypothetical protein
MNKTWILLAAEHQETEERKQLHGSTDLYMKMSWSSASSFPQREQASMAWRQISQQSSSSGSISKNE